MATGTMVIKYKENDIRNKANTVANKLDDAYDHVKKIDNKISTLEERSSKNYLNSASAFLRKKRTTLTTKRDNAQAFATHVDFFMLLAKDVDGRVADHIEDTYEQFKKITGINDSLWAAIGDFLASGAGFLTGLALLILGSPIVAALGVVLMAVSLVSMVKNWYENLPPEVKYWLKFIGEALVLVVAIVVFATATVATGGAFAAVFLVAVKIAAGVMIFDAIVGFTKAATVLAVYNSGNAGLAERLDGLSNGEAFGIVMGEITGTSAEAWATAYSITTFVASTILVVNNVSKFVGSVKELGFTGAIMDKVNPFKNIGDITKCNDWKGLFLNDLGLLSDNQIDTLKGVKAVCDLIKDVSGIAKPWPESFGEGFGDLFEKVPVIGSFKKIFDKLADIGKVKDNINDFKGLPHTGNMYTYNRPSEPAHSTIGAAI